jgi:magnesium-transporting ATPase (P-type)
MIVRVNLAKGAIAMAREKVIVKRLTAIQNIGAMNVLCADKTGTLRQDRITRYRLGWPSVKNRIGELPEERATACPNHHADCISANDIGVKTKTSTSPELLSISHTYVTSLESCEAPQFASLKLTDGMWRELWCSNAMDSETSHDTAPRSREGFWRT